MTINISKLQLAFAFSCLSIGTNLSADTDLNSDINLTSSAKRIVKVLEGMGYEDVSVSDCWI